MNVIALVFLIVSATSLLVVKRPYAPIPLLASCCYMTTGQGIQLGAISLPMYRMMLAIGLLRVIMKRESVVGGVNTIDKFVIAWAIWMVFAGFFHEWRPGSGPIYASGFVFNVTLVYFLMRVWCCDLDALASVIRVIAWLLVPVAISMILEHTQHRNFFGLLGGVPQEVYVRDGAIRAQGPFAHPILAGTVGAVTFPLIVGIWQRYRVSAMVGLTAAVAMVLASTSSGPLMSLLMGIFALFLWLRQSWVKVARWGVLGLYLLAEIVMERPAYYLISKIDLTGSSTGWHRSRLIEQAFTHIGRWWIFGTDYTGDWMAQTVDEEGRSADITNYYLWIGTIGGLPAMLLLIAAIWCAYVWVGRTIRNLPNASNQQRFLVWCLGAGLFAHTVTAVSVSYTDQSMVFLWLNVAAISSLYVMSLKMVSSPQQPSVEAPAAPAARKGPFRRPRVQPRLGRHARPRA